MLNDVELKKYLLKKGINSVGYTNVNGLVDEFSNLDNAISLLLKLPKTCIDALINEDYETYWKMFHQKVRDINEIALDCEKLIKANGFDAFALTMERNECDMEKLLSKLPYKSVATKAGLGWIGRSALFVCNDYGSAIVLCAVLTDMPLHYGTPITDSYCDDCEECQKACPVDAINPKKWNARLKRADIIDIETCSTYIIDQYKSGLGCSKCLSECKLTQEYLKQH